MKRSALRKTGWLLLELVLLAALGWVLTINRTEWIIRYGILAADRYLLLCRVGWAVLAVGLNGWGLAHTLRQKKRARAEAVRYTFAPDRPLSPAEIRAELLRFETARPRLRDALAQGMDQLENIERKQEKMAELLTRNDVSLLSQAKDALASAEQTLCRRLALVLNRALLCDPEEENTGRREAVLAEHTRAIRGFLADNEETLNRCETLLTETVRYVEEKKAGRDTMDLQVMTDVIRSLAGDGLRMNEPITR